MAIGLLFITHVCRGSTSIQTNALAQEQQTILTVHNQFRKLHHAAPLLWDDELAQFAKRHANMCRFKHSGSSFGENLAAGYPSLAAAINAWYAENALYSYNNPGFSYATGHFTQVVWKETQKIGCAYVACNGSGGTPGNYLVCEYSPAGNIANNGFFARNVLPV
jgi:uncharacterized protein YkwD